LTRTLVASDASPERVPDKAAVRAFGNSSPTSFLSAIHPEARWVGATSLPFGGEKGGLQTAEIGAEDDLDVIREFFPRPAH